MMKKFLDKKTYAVLLIPAFLLAGCAENSGQYARRYSAQECKQMHGVGNITLEQRRECMMTGKVKSAEKQETAVTK